MGRWRQMRILIVEDDSVNAQGLKQFILKLGYEDDVYTAANGREALNLMAQEQKFDLVFADIRMPVMNGLEFMQEAQHYYPELKVVILSAFNLFEYAQEALRLGAIDYILKPFSSHDIKTLLMHIRSTITDAGKITNRNMLSEHAQSIIMRWLVNPIQYADLAQKIIPQSEYVRAVVFTQPKISTASHMSVVPDVQTIMKATNSLLAGAFDGIYNCIFVHYPKSNMDFVGLLFSRSEAKESNAYICREIEAVLDSLNREFDIRLCATCSDAFKNPYMQTHLAFRQADTMCDSLFFLPPGRALFSDMCLSPGKGVMQPDYIDDLCDAMAKGDVALTEQTAAAMCDRLSITPFLPPFYLFSTLNLRISAVLNTLKNTMDTTDFSELNATLAQLLSEPGCLDDFRFAFQSLCKRVAACTMSSRNERCSIIMKQVQMYIAEHIADPCLSLASVAETFYFSPSHFSALFKNYNNNTFVSYVNAERIKSAQQLLKNPTHRIQDVAERVGFVDAGYFARVFKKQTGITPQEYRMRNCLPTTEGDVK